MLPAQAVCEVHVPLCSLKRGPGFQQRRVWRQVRPSPQLEQLPGSFCVACFDFEEGSLKYELHVPAHMGTPSSSLANLQSKGLLAGHSDSREAIMGIQAVASLWTLFTAPLQHLPCSCHVTRLLLGPSPSLQMDTDPYVCSK